MSLSIEEVVIIKKKIERRIKEEVKFPADCPPLARELIKSLYEPMTIIE